MSVTLTAATRQNLLSLQDTSALQSTTQNRLSTGKKVSSALDNAVSFFTAQGLDNRASDISNLLDGISNGVQTIQAANTGITNITKLVDQAKGLANQAKATQITTSGTASTAYAASAATTNFYVNGTAKTATLTATDTIDQAITKLNTGAGINAFTKDSTGTKLVINASANVEFKATADAAVAGFATGTSTAGYYGTGADVIASTDLTTSGVTERKSLATQYNNLLNQITQLSNDASYNGVNLINNSAASNKLHIQFNEKDTSNLDVAGVDTTATGLSLTAITADSGANKNQGNWLLDTDIASTSTKLTTASSTLRSNASTFGSNLSVVQNRQDFAKNLINVLQAGSAHLTNADLNEEAANSQALSTRQSLGISALSLASQSQQQVLQLLR